MRLTVTIPAATGAAVNAALADLLGDPAAARTFTDHPPLDDGTPDVSVLVCSWDLDATGHADAAEAIAAVIEQHGETGTGKTARTATIKVGPEPATALEVDPATLKTTLRVAAVDAADSGDVKEP